jgi:ABC-type nitrate/sulfonate/bicarbonate transport system permease component
VAVEFITAKSGLGHLVYRHWQMLSTPSMYAAFSLVGALGLLATRGLGALQRRLLVWQTEPETP